MDPNNPNLFTINWDKMLGVYELGLNQGGCKNDIIVLSHLLSECNDCNE